MGNPLAIFSSTCMCRMFQIEGHGSEFQNVHIGHSIHNLKCLGKKQRFGTDRINLTLVVSKWW